jgi:hypothetical protein
MPHAIILHGPHWLATTYLLCHLLFQVNAHSHKVVLLSANDETGLKETLLKLYSV